VKPLTAGSEIDAWCTKCKMDLGHRIVAMVQGAPKRVVCQTCGSEHNYRAPRSAPAAALRRVNGAGAAGAKKPPATAAQRVTEKARVESERVRSWESRIAGQALDAFTRYSIDRRYGVDELVKHGKFGEGYVLEVLDGEKVAIMFRDGPRTLAHGKG
jgi:hypothetical protein